MSRMLLLVPRMYTKSELKRNLNSIPEEYEQKSVEFWGYVGDKLKGFVGKIQRVYRDEIWVGGEVALARLASVERETFLLAKELVDHGAAFEPTEDAVLVAESESWREMSEHDPLDMIAPEMYQKSIRERDEYVSKRIEETLLAEETGVLFIEPTRTIKVSDAKIVKVCRFDPSDLLRSWQIQMSSRP